MYLQNVNLWNSPLIRHDSDNEGFFYSFIFFIQVKKWVTFLYLRI